MAFVALIVAVAAYAATQFYRFECVQPFCPQVGVTGTAATPTVFPKSMAGLWTGTIHQTDDRAWPIELRIKEGDTVATVRYRDLGCAGTVTFVDAPTGVLRAREHITSGSCTPNGWVSLATVGGNLEWTYVPDGDRYTATGRLSRTAPSS
jgi:hypothetical protein